MPVYAFTGQIKSVQITFAKIAIFSHILRLSAFIWSCTELYAVARFKICIIGSIDSHRFALIPGEAGWRHRQTLIQGVNGFSRLPSSSGRLNKPDYTRLNLIKTRQNKCQKFFTVFLSFSPLFLRISYSSCLLLPSIAYPINSNLWASSKPFETAYNAFSKIDWRY